MRAIAEVIPIVNDADAVPPVLAKRLDALQTQISTADESSLRPRWEFGRELVRLRGGKRKLPTGVIRYMEETHHVAVRELQYRAKFAEVFPTES